MHISLLIMAAGLGSRYGGDKQIDRIGPNGEILMEYSIHDAIEAGFDKVVFVIKPEMEAKFREMVGNKIAGKTAVHYAFQDYSSLPEGFVPPEGRTKPYGTVHAVLCAKNIIAEPFAVINADDYYGRDAFVAMAESLKSMQDKKAAASMVAYDLHNTISANGTVTRGVCERDAQNHLVKVTETYKIQAAPDGTIRDYASDEQGRLLDPNALVSMNFWGFTPWFFEAAERKFREFLFRSHPDVMKCEYVLPTLVDELMREEHLQVDVLNTHAMWFGMTYREDREYVIHELKKLHDAGFYPRSL
ncbi:MAG: NTP transferase domain-containing protein [Clostridiales bacterium]|nr:NTP transferase domain-containing protein [Clostridia bacterium]MCR4885165.1 NTP transferase domain-containing protein [Clostridiales bacterium]